MPIISHAPCRRDGSTKLPSGGGRGRRARDPSYRGSTFVGVGSGVLSITLYAVAWGVETTWCSIHMPPKATTARGWGQVAHIALSEAFVITLDAMAVMPCLQSRRDIIAPAIHKRRYGP